MAHTPVEAAATSIRAMEAKAKEMEDAPLALVHWFTETPWAPPAARVQPVLPVVGLPVPLQSVLE